MSAGAEHYTVAQMAGWLEAQGAVVESQRGSHVTWRLPNSRTVSAWDHGQQATAKKHVARELFAKNARELNVTTEQLRALLDRHLGRPRRAAAAPRSRARHDAAHGDTPAAEDSYRQILACLRRIFTRPGYRTVARELHQVATQLGHIEARSRGAKR